MSLLDVTGLHVRYPESGHPVVDELGFSVASGEAVGIVGESGSGKTQTALAILGLLPANARVSGSICFDGEELVGATQRRLNRLRARRIAMIFQDPLTALNPYVTIGAQLCRVLLEHRLGDRSLAKSRTLDMLHRVGLPDPERQYAAYPHQLSGGMRQRAMIGAALLGEPDLIVADEPTTALDVTVQAQILRLLRNIRDETGAALLLITHDLGVIAGNCERMLVMQGGRQVETGPTRKVFAAPQSGQTRALIAAVPRLDAPGVGDSGQQGEPLLAADDVSVKFRERAGASLQAVRDVSLAVGRGETLAVVGESGSGKSSLARAMLGLVPASAGRVSYLGRALPNRVQRRDQATRRQLQMVFQDPLASLDPAMTAADIIGEPLLVHEARLKAGERARRVAEMMDEVGLGAALADRYPHELSGGQAQRVAIARALVLRPSVLICDEAVSALDGTVRQEILTLLRAEQLRSGLAIVFIAHDLAVVRQVSHQVLVMYLGRLCETAGTDALFRRPRHPYSRALLDAVPVADPDHVSSRDPLPGEVSSIIDPPAGCPFHPRCRHAVERCRTTLPLPAPLEAGMVACHRADELDLSTKIGVEPRK